MEIITQALILDYSEKPINYTKIDEINHKTPLKLKTKQNKNIEDQS
jgi:hypothetical protein